MKLLNRYARTPCTDILVRPDRQRQDLSIEDLLPSIRRYGVINPIILERAGPPHTLVAGERRLRASQAAGLLDIPSRFVDELSSDEAELLELEENLKRKDLTWQEQTRAIGRIHTLYVTTDPEWTQTQTAERIGISAPHITKHLRIFRDLSNPAITQSPTMQSAYGVLTRKDERAYGDVLTDISNAGRAVAAQAQTRPSPGPGGEPPPPPTPPAEPESILLASFLEWAPHYSGPLFNLIHCDFPYGVNFNSGPLSGSAQWETYDDSPQVYWDLLTCLLSNLDRFMAPSGHLLFWLSADITIQHQTLVQISAQSDLKVHPKPLVWMKSDNVGVLASPNRLPRHIYETCLFASREDRMIVRAKADAYCAPTDKSHHPSTKPEPVLRHFMEMLVDEHTRLLDPTCGSGSSLRAAESLGAEWVLGLENSPEHHANARIALRQFRSLRRAAK